MLNAVKTGIAIAGMLAIVGFYGWQERLISQQPPRSQPSPQENRNTADNQKAAEAVKEITGPAAFLYFFTPGGLQKIADYCGSKPDNEPDKWLHDKFICEVRATDIVTAVASVLLVVVTAGLIWVAISQIRTTRRQLRAYVFCEGRTGDEPTFDANVEMRIPLHIRNTGQTPAYNVRQWVDFDVRPYPFPRNLPVPEPTGEPSVMILGPGSEALIFAHFTRPLSIAERDGLSAGHLRMCIWGHVSYNDAFSLWRLRHTKFRYMIAVNQNGSVRGLQVCDTGNSSS